MGVDRPLVRLEGDPVDGVEELRPGEHPSRLAGHGGEELELGGGEVHALTAHGHEHPSQVELEIADMEDVLGARGRLRAPEHRAHSRHELPRAERLGHVVVSTELKADEGVRFVGPGGEHDDGQAARPADRAGHVQAVAVRQSQVEHDEVGSLCARDAQRGLRGPRGQDAEPSVGQVIGREPADVRRVVDDEDGGHRGDARRSGGPDAAERRRGGSPPSALGTCYRRAFGSPVGGCGCPYGGCA